MGEPTVYILDSYALLAFLEDETGGAQVADILKRAAAGEARLLFSLINFGECIYIVERERGLAQAQALIAAVDQLPVQVIPPDRSRVFAAAHIKALYPLSYADAFAVGLAEEEEGTLITGDREFERVAERIAILWLT